MISIKKLHSPLILIRLTQATEQTNKYSPIHLINSVKISQDKIVIKCR